MKHAIILTLGISSLLYCMEQPSEKKYEIYEWDAQAYHNGCNLQTNSFLHFLKANNITIKQQNILDMGCGTCKIAQILAQQALHIHCVDASFNMIDFAQKNTPASFKNISFEQSCAENFTSNNCYQLAIMSSCFHWLQDKKKALQSIYNSLKNDGEFFANIISSDNPIPFNLQVFNRMKTTNIILKNALESCTQNPIASSYPTVNELKKMFDETGFKVIKIEEQSYSCAMTQEEFIQLQLPIIKSRPFVKTLSNEQFQNLFTDFIQNCLSKLKETTEKKYIYPFIQTIVHAKKQKTINQ